MSWTCYQRFVSKGGWVLNPHFEAKKHHANVQKRQGSAKTLERGISSGCRSQNTGMHQGKSQNKGQFDHFHCEFVHELKTLKS